MMQFSAAVASLAVSNNTLSANITVTTIAYKSILIIDFASANTTSRHNYLQYFILVVFPKIYCLFTLISHLTNLKYLKNL